MLNTKNEIIGFLALREYPPIPAIDPKAWEEYIWARYKMIELKARNTLWIHLMCLNKMYGRNVVDELLQSVFKHEPYLHYICMMKTDLSYPQLIPGSSRVEASFKRVQAMERGLPGDKLPVLLVAERLTLCPRMRVRRAVEEDNDDIVPIIDRHSPRLRELYGDFYVSELISRHPESERVLLVCEHKEQAVGVMCLNTQINYESLEECFELSPYAGLRKLDKLPHKVKSTDTDVGSTFEVSNDDAESTVNFTSVSALCMSTISEKKKLTPKSSNVLIYVGDDGNIVGNTTILEYLDLFTEDEEDFEFDIINIDPALVRQSFMPLTILSKSTTEIEPREERTVSQMIVVPKKDVKKASIAVTRPPDAVCRYSGTSNAFLLELCAMHHDHDERRAFDMLEAAFDIFPDRDYCIISLPSSHVPLPLLENFSSVTPLTTRMRFVNDSLYVAHVNSIRGDVSVRPGEQADAAHLNDLIEHSPNREVLTELFQEALKSYSIDSFMLLAQRQPIGVVFVSPVEDEVSIRVQNELLPEPTWPLTDGEILAGTMSPVMEPHARWYLREIMRHTRFTTLFWLSQPYAKGAQSPKRNLMSLIDRLLPVKARGSLPNISGVNPVDKLFMDLPIPFAVWIIDRPISFYPKININNNIVVVGASRTGLAFIETLIAGPTSKYLTFSNLTLVSEHGVPTVTECLKAADTAIPQEGRYTDLYLKTVPFCFYVDVIPAVLVEIDRKKKCIYLSNGSLKYYDDLILTCGQQFQHPDYLKESLEKVQTLRKGEPCERVLMDNPKYQPDRVPLPPRIPENLFLINSLLQANVVFSKLLLMLADRRKELTEKRRVVVYGDCLEAYCCISALLELGLSGNEIAFVENFPPEDFTVPRVNCFNDEVIDGRVQESLDDLGVKCYRNFRLTQLHIHNNNVTLMYLMDPLHLIQVECFALFYYGIKAIDINVFRAINQSGLVYDGGLVVSPSFETNDPHIYGAGSCCTYSRSLYAHNRNHKHYMSEEVGEALADFFLHRLNPFISCHPDYNPKDLLPRCNSFLYCRRHSSIPDVTESRLHFAQQIPGRAIWQPVLKFQNPIVKACTLPGPLFYLKARKPGPDFPMEVQLTLPHQGHSLLTDRNENYLRVHLNVLHCVDAVTCLARDEFPIPVLSRLYGKHESFFNKLLLRFQMNLINDLYFYFVRPWMSGMYQETFEELMENINTKQIDPQTIEEIKKKFDVLNDSKTAKEEQEPETIDTLKERSGRLSSTFSSKEQPRKRSSMSQAKRISGASKLSTCFDIPECQTVEEPKLPTALGFLIREFADRTGDQLNKDRRPSDVPSECGQSAPMRAAVTEFWKALEGEKIVEEEVAQYLHKYAVPNPHYARTHPKYYKKDF